MKLTFHKMHGTMNDYIFVDNLEGDIDKKLVLSKLIPLCHRHSGIASDGVIFLSPSQIADAKMEMYNADGSRAEMCGNGSRCCIKLLSMLGKISTKGTLETDAGLIEAEIEGELVKMKMFYAPSVMAREEKVKSEDKIFSFYRAEIGNPHAVIAYDGNLEDLEIEKYGKPIENNLGLFPARVNVEFYKEIGPGHLKMRVWERGSGETFACGTGAASVAAVYRTLKKETLNHVKVEVLGGCLFFDWRNSDFFMTGEVKYVYRGEIDL